MKHRIGLLAASALVAALGFVAPSPSSAHVDTCAGTGDAFLDTGLYAPTHGPAMNSGFTFALSVGACASLGTLTASGTLTGWCGQSAGLGTTNTGHNFSYTSAGTVLAVTGEVNGTVDALEDPLDTGSCLNGTAKHFIIEGAAELHHCTTYTNDLRTTTNPTVYSHTVTCVR